MGDTSSSARIFISYAHADAEAADIISTTLADIGLTPWIDRTAIHPGDSFIERMNQGLGQASYVLLLMSRASMNSRWVSREWMAALAAAETVLLPILLEDCDIPPILRDIVYIDFRSERERGLTRLRTFFERERAPAIPSEIARSKAPGVTLRSASRRTLRLVALRCMEESHLEGFFFDVGLDSGMLRGNTRHERITSLLVRVATDGLLEQFADWLALEPSCQRCVTRELTNLRQEDVWSQP